MARVKGIITTVMEEVFRSFTVSLYNNTSENFDILDSSILMGQWAMGEAPKKGSCIEAGTVGGPWVNESVQEDMGAGAVIVLNGIKGEVVLHWMLTEDGKCEMQLGQEHYEISSERVDDIHHENYRLWRFCINDLVK